MSSKIKDLEGHVRSSKLYVNRQKENGGGGGWRREKEGEARSGGRGGLGNCGENHYLFFLNYLLIFINYFHYCLLFFIYYKIYCCLF